MIKFPLRYIRLGSYSFLKLSTIVSKPRVILGYNTVNV